LIREGVIFDAVCRKGGKSSRVEKEYRENKCGLGGGLTWGPSLSQRNEKAKKRIVYSHEGEKKHQGNGGGSTLEEGKSVGGNVSGKTHTKST